MVNLSADNNVFGGFAGEKSGDAVWGDISGNIDNQTDLIERLIRTYKVVLNPNGWELHGNDNIYVQTRNVPGIKAEDNVAAYINFSDEEETSKKESLCWNNLDKISVFDGYIKAYIKGSAPEIPLNIFLIVF